MADHSMVSKAPLIDSPVYQPLKSAHVRVLGNAIQKFISQTRQYCPNQFDKPNESILFTQMMRISSKRKSTKSNYVCLVALDHKLYILYMIYFHFSLLL